MSVFVLKVLVFLKSWGADLRIFSWRPLTKDDEIGS